MQSVAAEVNSRDVDPSTQVSQLSGASRIWKQFDRSKELAQLCG